MPKRPDAKVTTQSIDSGHAGQSDGVLKGGTGRPPTQQATILTCPHCGLSLKIEHHAGGPILVYDRNEWNRRCRQPDLNSPAYCLSEEFSR